MMKQNTPNLTRISMISVVVVIAITFSAVKLLDQFDYYRVSDTRFSLIKTLILAVGLGGLLSSITLWISQQTTQLHRKSDNPLDVYSVDTLAKELDRMRVRWPTLNLEKRAVLLSQLEDLLLYKILHKQEHLLYTNIFDLYCLISSEYTSPEAIGSFVDDCLRYVSQYQLGILIPKSDY